MDDEFLKVFNEFKAECDSINLELKKRIDNSDSKEVIATKENLSISTSECLCEDIQMVINLQEKKYSNRYIDSIIRNMCEQIIEYKYIIKNQSLIGEYFGKNLSEDEDKECEDTKKMFSRLKQTGQARFSSNRESVSKMAEDINEKVSTDEKIALYDIFSLKAELEHNSYFNSVFEIIDQIEEQENDSHHNLDITFICFIIGAFKETYYKV